MQNVDHMQELENLLKEVLAELVRQEYENRPKHFKRHFFLFAVSAQNASHDQTGECGTQSG